MKLLQMKPLCFFYDFNEIHMVNSNQCWPQFYKNSTVDFFEEIKLLHSLNNSTDITLTTYHFPNEKYSAYTDLLLVLMPLVS